MSFHGGFVGALLALVLFARSRGLSVLGLLDRRRAPWRRSACSSGASRTSSTASSGAGRRRTSPTPSSSRTAGPLPRHPSQIYEAFAEGLVLFVLLGARGAPLRLPPPGPDRRPLPPRLRRGARASASCSASPTRSSASCSAPPRRLLGGGITMGHDASLPMALAGIAAIASRCARRAAARGRCEPRRRDAPLRRDARLDRPRRADHGRALHGALPRRTASTAITPRAIPSARRATSRRRPRSARCSAS